MVQPLEDKEVTLADFDENLAKFSIRFKNRRLEDEYLEKRIDPLNVKLFFRITFIVLVAIIAARRVESLVFAILGIESDAASVKAELINVVFMAAVLIIEAVVYFVKPLRLARGSFFMVFIFFSICYASYSANNQRLGIIPA